MANKRCVDISNAGGKNSKEFKFIFVADNGSKLSEKDTYKNKADLVAMLKKYFPGFRINDKTKK